MSRKRFITSKICTDKKIAMLAEENPTAALMWPWLLTNLDDWGRMGADPVELKLTVFPAFPFTSTQIAEAIQLMDKYGLVHYYVVDGRPYIAVNPATFYKYQTYIKSDRKAKENSKCPAPPNPPWEEKQGEASACDDNQQKSAKNCDNQQTSTKIVLSPSPSLSIKDNDDNNMAAQTIGFVACFEQEFGRPISPSEFERLYAFLTNDGMDDAVVCEAIRRARANGVPKLTYVEAILKEWRNNQVTNLAGVERVDKEFEKRKGVKKFGAAESQAGAPDANGGGGAKKSKYPVLHVIDGKEFYG